MPASTPDFAPGGFPGEAPAASFHSALPPGEVLALLRPAMRPAGITRLAVLTGLDVLGVPVAAAMRPNSRTIAVHQGKGASTDAAKLAAVMEAVECHCAESLDLPLRLATPADMRASGAAMADVAALPRAQGGGDPEGRRLLWVRGEDLLGGGEVWVPREIVSADWAWPTVPGEPCFQATTNGLGAGLSLAAASLHGLYEAVERDAVAVWRARLHAARVGSAVDPASVDAPASLALLRHLDRCGARVAIWDATSDVGMPVFVVLLADAAGRLQPELGSGCHADPDAALFRALTEAAQSRLTVISGARDDFSDDDYAPADRTRFARAAFLERPSRAFAATERAPGGDLAAVLGRLAACGVRQVVRVDLSREETAPARVARIVVPGLEGGHTGPEGEYVPGARARAAAG